jgi:hypothetical protein
MAGALFMVVAAGYWMLRTGTQPDYLGAFLPGCSPAASPPG